MGAKESTESSGDVGGTNTNARPRAVIHKKILDAARENPSASTDAIAEEVSGASPAVVDRVLDEYGDPAAADPESQELTDGGPAQAESGPESNGTEDAAVEEPASTADPGGASRGDEGTVASESAADSEPAGDVGTVPDPAELSEAEYETFAAIAETPAASQKDLAAKLGVSRATVSKRVNAFDGFEWRRRQQFVDRLFDDDPGRDGGGTAGRETARRDSTVGASESRDDARREPERGATADGDFEARVSALEDRLDDRAEDPHSPESAAVTDPELLHKVVHAAMDAEYVSREEELELLREVLPTGDATPT